MNAQRSIILRKTKRKKRRRNFIDNFNNLILKEFIYNCRNILLHEYLQLFITEILLSRTVRGLASTYAPTMNSSGDEKVPIGEVDRGEGLINWPTAR